MPVSLSCPSCRSPVEAADADRGKSIRCEVCWAEVSVPNVAAVPAARLLSATPVKPAPASSIVKKATVAAKAAPVAAPPPPPTESEPVFEIIDEAPTPEPRSELSPLSPLGLEADAPSPPAAEEPPSLPDLSAAAAPPLAPPPPSSFSLEPSGFDLSAPAPVPEPVAEAPPPPPPPPILTAVVVAAVPVAKAIPAAKAAPVAKAVAIPAAKLAPVAKLEPARPKSEAVPKARARHRDEEDEDDRPRRRGEPVEKKGNGLLIVLGVIALVLLLAGGGVGYYLYRTYKAAENIVENLNDAAPDANPFNGFQPGTPGPQKPFWALDWGVVPGDGFTARMPLPAPRMAWTESIDGEQLRGARYQSHEGSVFYKAHCFDLPAEPPLTAQQFVDRVAEYVGSRESGPTPVTVAGRPATQWVRKPLTGERETLRALKVGCRVFVFIVAYHEEMARRNPGLDPDAKAREYFDSVRITFDPSTPAPPATAKKPKGPIGGGTPTPPVGPPPVGPSPFPRPGSGGFQIVGQIQPFLAAVLLPERQELLTFAPRGPTGGGVVRRVSTTSFKTLGEKFLPNPVVQAVADEANGRLYVATVKSAALIGPDGGNVLFAAGDIVSYDLNAVTGDAELKPLATAAVGAKVAGLELTPKGTILYAATVTFDGQAVKRTPPKTLVVKFDAAKLTPAGEIELPQPVGALRLSGNGKHLFAAEYPYNSAGYPQTGSTGEGTVHLIDVAGWAKKQTVRVPATVTDVRFVEADKALVVMSAGMRQCKLATLDGQGQVTDVTPAGLRVRGGFAAVVPDKGRVVLSGRVFPGADVVGYANGEIRPLAALPQPEGPVVVSPDGKTAFHGSGAVVDLSGVK